MKKLKLIIAAAGIVAVASACRMDRHHNSRHVVISEDTNNNYLKIEYAGKTYFNNEGTAIASITPNGYVKYKKNGQQLIARSDGNGVITYELNHGTKMTTLDTTGRVFLAQAVKDMIQHGHYNDGK